MGTTKNKLGITNLTLAEHRDAFLLLASKAYPWKKNTEGKLEKDPSTVAELLRGPILDLWKPLHLHFEEYAIGKGLEWRQDQGLGSCCSEPNVIFYSKPPGWFTSLECFLAVKTKWEAFVTALAHIGLYGYETEKPENNDWIFEALLEFLEEAMIGNVLPNLACSYAFIKEEYEHIKKNGLNSQGILSNEASFYPQDEEEPSSDYKRRLAREIDEAREFKDTMWEAPPIPDFPIDGDETRWIEDSKKMLESALRLRVKNVRTLAEKSGLFIPAPSKKEFPRDVARLVKFQIEGIEYEQFEEYENDCKEEPPDQETLRASIKDGTFREAIEEDTTIRASIERMAKYLRLPLRIAAKGKHKKGVETVGKGQQNPYRTAAASNEDQPENIEEMSTNTESA